MKENNLTKQLNPRFGDHMLYHNSKFTSNFLKAGHFCLRALNLVKSFSTAQELNLRDKQEQKKTTFQILTLNTTTTPNQKKLGQYGKRK